MPGMTVPNAASAPNASSTGKKTPSGLTSRIAGYLETLARALRRHGRDDSKVLVLGGVRSGRERRGVGVLGAVGWGTPRRAGRPPPRHSHLVYVAPGLPASDDDPEWA